MEWMNEKIFLDKLDRPPLRLHEMFKFLSVFYSHNAQALAWTSLCVFCETLG